MLLESKLWAKEDLVGSVFKNGHAAHEMLFVVCRLHVPGRREGRSILWDDCVQNRTLRKNLQSAGSFYLVFPHLAVEGAASNLQGLCCLLEIPVGFI